MIRAVFFDVDGTLVSFRTHRIPQSAKDAVSVIRKKGIKVFIATGRPYPAIDNLEDLEYDGCISTNGSYAVDHDGSVLFEKYIPREDVERLAGIIEERGYPCITVHRDEVFINRVDGKVERAMKMLNFMKLPVRPTADMLSGEVMQLIVFMDRDAESEIMPLVPSCRPARWHEDFVDMIPCFSNKSSAVKNIIGMYGISREEVMAFGDGGNDIDMLEFAGIGVAMGNAEEDVMESADYVTSAVDEDGVSKALEHFGLL